MKKEVQAVLNLIKDLGIEDDIFQALGGKSAKRSVVEAISKPKKTSNGYEIYYDERSNEVVGIVYKNRVFLKTTSSERINWHEAAEYCKSIIINGITSQFCPVDDNWKKEFCNVYQNLYQALKEIGAENLDYYTWCSEYDDTWAWTQRFSDGGVSYNFNKNLSYYVRPVLVLNR